MNPILLICSILATVLIAYVAGRHLGYEDGWKSRIKFVNDMEDGQK